LGGTVAKGRAHSLNRQQGERLKRLREQAGLSMPKMRVRLGFRNTRAYDLYERGVIPIRLDRVTAWAAAFGVSPETFLDDVLDLPRSLLTPPSSSRGAARAPGRADSRRS
jgi:transcriptional regulator with XRE-family HTH domain